MTLVQNFCIVEPWNQYDFSRTNQQLVSELGFASVCFGFQINYAHVIENLGRIIVGCANFVVADSNCYDI